MINKIFLCLNSSAHSDCSSHNLSIIFSSFFPPSSLVHRKSGDNSGSRQIRNTPDWSENAVSGDHLWVPTSVSGDCCYVGDSDCTVSFAVSRENIGHFWQLFMHEKNPPTLIKLRTLKNNPLWKLREIQRIWRDDEQFQKQNSSTFARHETII